MADWDGGGLYEEWIVKYEGAYFIVCAHGWVRCMACHYNSAIATAAFRSETEHHKRQCEEDKGSRAIF